MMNLRQADPVLLSWWREFGDDWWRDHGEAMEAAHRSMGLARARPKTGVRIADCRQLIGQRYGVENDEMLSDAKPRRVARPRQMAMTLARDLTGASAKLVGEQFGGRDHTTVLFAEHQVREREQDSMRIAMDMEGFRLALLTYAAQRKVTLADLQETTP